MAGLTRGRVSLLAIGMIVLFTVLYCFEFVELSSFRDTTSRAAIKNFKFTPQYHNIWMTGFNPRDEEDTSSWVNSLPNFVCKQYPDANVLVVKQDRRAVSARAFGRAPLQISRCNLVDHKPTWTPILEPPESNNRKAATNQEFNITHQMNGTKQYPPDLHFIRNAYRITGVLSRVLPWLYAPTTLRVVYPVHFFAEIEVADLILHTDSFLKPLPDWQIDIFERLIYERIQSHRHDITRENYKSLRIPKENYLLYPATVATQKGQLEFATAIDPVAWQRHNLTIVFVGQQIPEYAEKVWDILRSKNIRFEYRGFLEERERLADLYVGARAVILFSRADPGPRVIYEALYGGCPYLVGHGVELDSRLSPFGMRLESVFMEDLNEKLETFLSVDWGTAPVDFARAELTEARVMSNLFFKLDGVFCSTFPERCLWTAT
eukprot:TRINITY_DN7411_c0_g1_i1.p1 TRINITY_DN7411_c0_g1~~TRINITY_DN7411_c0_g1_i1.p1  ORF type:complete len:434 (-),score=66.72 TRINITY_DN7411_c0_g1_i1:154-1455(-)